MMEMTSAVTYTDSQFKRLRIYNLVMGFVHLAQAVVIFILSNDFSLQVTTAFPTFNQVTRTLEPITQTVFNLPIGPLAGVFLLISSIAHFTLSTVAYNWYVRNLRRHINYARWYEYALSSSIMIVLIAMLSGMYDLAALILIFVLNAIMNLFGLMMELHNQTTPKTNWTAYIFGSISGVVPWIAIAIYFFGTISASTDAVPTFVYFILPTLFVFFFSFALNMVLQYKKVGPWRDYLFGERVYVLLSLLAKSALAWQVFGGALAGVSS